MNGQKKENLLNLSLDATEEEREKSPALQVGFNREEKRWELIVKYNGELETITAEFPE
ncbi:MAG: peptidase S8, partial [Clostridium sp.]|nr:peptidase S8 [Clostridium sp.]